MHVAWFHRCAFLRAACTGTYLASVINFNQRIGAMAKSNLAVIVGSNRRDSINRKLAHALAKLGAGSFEANFPRIDDLPMFNELARADAVLIVTPEHDRSIPALLKNAVDWGARPYGKNSWVGKPAFITGTSPGAIGSALAQHHLRSIMVGLGATLLGGEAYVTFKPDLVDEAGNIADEGTRQFLQGFIDRFATLVRRLTSAESARSAA
jgi:chromate reductase, NAD(P)H dehydrogenase (quinone)